MHASNLFPSPLNTPHRTKGNTKLSIDANIRKNGSILKPPDLTVTAHAHAMSCEVDNGGPHYLNDVTGLDSGDNILQISLQFDASTSKATGTVTRPWLTDYERAGSVVLHDSSGVRFACCNLVPNLPSLPDTWSATIEANFQQPDSNISYTMLRKEWYHKVKPLNSQP